MFDALLRLLTGSDDAPPADGNDPALALAVLLLETARSDDSVAESERRIIERAWRGASICSRSRQRASSRRRGRA